MSQQFYFAANFILDDLRRNILVLEVYVCKKRYLLKKCFDITIYFLTSEISFSITVTFYKKDKENCNDVIANNFF